MLVGCCVWTETIPLGLAETRLGLAAEVVTPPVVLPVREQENKTQVLKLVALLRKGPPQLRSR